MKGYDFKSILFGIGIGIIMTAFVGIITLAFFLD